MKMTPKRAGRGRGALIKMVAGGIGIRRGGLGSVGGREELYY